jgi:hypothetical protein
VTAIADSDAEPWDVPLSALEHYAYCHRQMALIRVESAWAENIHTVRGDLSHTAVDLPGIRKRAGVVVVRSLPVWSDLAIHHQQDSVRIYRLPPPHSTMSNISASHEPPTHAAPS